MKKILTLVLIYTIQFSESQCGTWQIFDTIIQVTKSDTIGKYKPKKDSNWVYSNFRISIIATPAIYCNCGCGWPYHEYGFRINMRGVKQEIDRIIRYKYIEPLETGYDKILKEIQK